MARSSRAVADECIFHVFELAEDAIQDRGDLPAGHVIDALRDETAVELDDLIRGAVLRRACFQLLPAPSKLAAVPRV